MLHPKPKIFCRKASTLIELIVYMAVVSITVTSLVLFGWNIITSGEKITRQEEVSSSASLLAEKIKFAIRNANGINTAASDFEVNFGLYSNKKISLADNAPNDPTLIDVASGQARIALGTSAPIAITSPGVRVSNLVFSNYSSSDGKTTNIGFAFTVENNNPSPGNVYEHSTVVSSAEVRSK